MISYNFICFNLYRVEFPSFTCLEKIYIIARQKMKDIDYQYKSVKTSMTWSVGENFDGFFGSWWNEVFD